MKKKNTRDFYSKWFIAPAAILFIIFFVVPNLASFVLGFTDWSLYDFNNIKFIDWKISGDCSARKLLLLL